MKNRYKGYKDKGYLIKVSEVNKILQKYRNLNLTYDLIREIVGDINKRVMDKNIMIYMENINNVPKIQEIYP